MSPEKISVSSLPNISPASCNNFHAFWGSSAALNKIGNFMLSRFCIEVSACLPAFSNLRKTEDGEYEKNNIHLFS